MVATPIAQHLTSSMTLSIENAQPPKFFFFFTNSEHSESSVSLAIRIQLEILV